MTVAPPMPLGAVDAAPDEGGARPPARRRLTLAHVLFAAAAIISFFTLLGSPVKGLANQGDYQRLMAKLGVVQVGKVQPGPNQLVQYYRTGLTEHQAEVVFGDVVPASEKHYYYGAHGYLSSQLLIDAAGIQAARLLSNPARVDIRWIGAVNALFLLAGIALVLVALRQLPGAARVVAGVLVVLAFTDFGYLGYFNSFFSEPSELIFLLASFGAAGAVPVCTGWRRGAMYATFVVATVGFVWSKEGDFIGAAPLIIVGASIGWRYFRRWWARAGAFAALGVLLVATGLSLGANIPYYQVQHYYDGTFDGILLSTPTPAQAVKELGLAPGLAQYAGFPSFARGDSAFAAAGINSSFFAHVTYTKMVKFYVEHPKSLIAVLSRASGTSLYLRVPYLANLTTGSDAHYATSSPWTYVHRHILPRSLWFVLLVPTLTVSIGVWGLVHRKRLRYEMTPELLVALGFTALVNYVEPVVAEGFNELIKHQFLFNASFDLCLIVDIAVLVATSVGLVRRLRPSVEPRRELLPPPSPS